ncbi:Stp1/IreP family PP2C-type Ser/Thr phosphatase [Aerococcus suis]|uniref:protein-serine/threonine phosphatase n=1 Tax=Aerococcus suis TaxID=371602 RepID=A0A1W1Y3R9_9LACT|nr:Stp1/IreP family PP2C-type Ser/Thr phosphatase [Aerococcus suis]MCI7240446.1 Stp1/IreP family PP2C-type Ser/Thr phosphatase [Aerococcus suis]MDD7758917.1 Stp1/IreP family PP2C-type Ser/Thr phosphatase [Aerococcus suis]MDY4646226.1 Stp1/IreP family PP2C-type Ser/Thr phosphatase [Aerococcus suis]SMC30471.1 protein phosphatase [Aerococcus suis]
MKIAQLTDVGAKRQTNQDQVGVFNNQDQLQLLVLCDGMGGHNAGDVASEMALFHIGHAWEQTEAMTDSQFVMDWMVDMISQANTRVYEKGQQYLGLQGMGTTLIAVVVLDGQALIAHVGDSRVYQIKNRLIEQVTKDHSFVQELVDSQVITEEEAQTHPQRNIVTRAIGTDQTVNIETQILPLELEDVLLICSDGLTDMIPATEAIEVFNQATTLEEAAEALISAANASGGKDNISVILAQIEGSDIG